MNSERLTEESPTASCSMDADCIVYNMCRSKRSCKCQSWGECHLLHVVGEPCSSDLECSEGLFCTKAGASSHQLRCVPLFEMADLIRYADQPETDEAAQSEIPPAYEGALLVASISIFLVLICLILAGWCRFTSPVPQRNHNNSYVFSIKTNSIQYSTNQRFSFLCKYYPQPESESSLEGVS